MIPITKSLPVAKCPPPARVFRDIQPSPVEFTIYLSDLKSSVPKTLIQELSQNGDSLRFRLLAG
jgi:hypothetical protein